MWLLIPATCMIKTIVSFFVPTVIVMFTVSCKSNAQINRMSFDTAFVQKMKDHDSLSIKIYIKGKNMVHDLPSLLKGPTYYIDSMTVFVPYKRDHFFKFDEVHTLVDTAAHYPFVKGGITFSSDSVRIDLTVYDYDRKEAYSNTWNGTYLLKWVQ